MMGTPASIQLHTERREWLQIPVSLLRFEAGNEIEKPNRCIMPVLSRCQDECRR